MRLHLLVVDDFLSEPHEYRDHALIKGFRDETSPADGLSYKGVGKHVPWAMKNEVESRLAYLLQATIDTKLMFFRLSVENLSKRWIHVDPMYADNVCLIYLNEEYPKDAGTIMYEHPLIDVFQEGMQKEQIEAWDRDANHPERWMQSGIVPMKWNRASIYSTKIFHSPSPRNGFGQDEQTGRLVFCTFFNVIGG
jgi:hypothetical protein